MIRFFCRQRFNHDINYRISEVEHLLQQQIGTGYMMYHELAYEKSGKPSSCIQYYQMTATPTLTTSATSETESPSTTPQQLIDTDEYHSSLPNKYFPLSSIWVKVEMIAAPWNPADALNVMGKYPNPYSTTADDNGTAPINPFKDIAQQHRCSFIHPRMVTRTVPGSEGWGRIIEMKQIAPIEKIDINDERRNDGSSSTTTIIHKDPVLSTYQSNNISKHQNIQVGDYVTMGQPGLGTLRSHLYWLPISSVIRIQHGPELFDTYGPFVPAPLFQTGGTAYRMIHDYCHWTSEKPLTVIQNAGNSAVGLMLSQIVTNIHDGACISLVRSNHRTTNNEMNDLLNYMKQYGTNQKSNFNILPEESIGLNGNVDWDELSKTTNIPVSRLRNVRYAFNGVGGTSIQQLLPFLCKDATIVTYGNMSKESSISIDPSKLIFDNIHYTGFWYSRWMVQQQYKQFLLQQKKDNHKEGTNSTAASSDMVETSICDDDDVDSRTTMMNELVSAVLEGKIKLPQVQSYPLSKFQSALLESSNSNQKIRTKTVFDCRE